MDENIWRTLGRSQIMIQCIFWTLCIYVCDFDLVFECFDDSVIQFIILFTCVYHQICAIRNFYCAIHTSSIVKPISKKEKEEKNILNTTECKKCGIIRPSRSHHCSVCEKCIEKLDHHCYFLNNCVGRKNYKFFFSYLFLSMINSIIMIVLGVFRFYLYKQKEMEKLNKMKYIKFNLEFLINFPIKVILLELISIPTFIGCVYLLIYHLFLININQTTIERKYPSLYIKDPSKKDKSFCEKFSEILENENWLNIYWLE